jgi:hypothetical protein
MTGVLGQVHLTCLHSQLDKGASPLPCGKAVIVHSRPSAGQAQNGSVAG